MYRCHEQIFRPRLSQWPFSHKKSAHCSWEAASRSEDATGRRRGVRVRRLHAKAGREFLGALEGSLALFETGAVIPEIIVKGWIALDGLPTAGTFLPLEHIAALHHISSRLTPHAGGPSPCAAVVVYSFPVVP